MTKIEILKPILFLSEARKVGDIVSVRDASLVKALISGGYVKLVRDDKKVISKPSRSSTKQKKVS